MNNKTIGIALVALLIGGAIGYFAHPASAAPAGGQFIRNGMGGFGGGRSAGGMGMNGGFLSGTVATKDSDSLTLNTRDGSSHIVIINSSTGVSKTVPGTLSDVSIGSNVMIIGTSNSDGSILATMIQIRPATSTTAR